MNGLPYYKRYPRDFIEGTIGMCFELKAAYALVLDLIYMQDGRLPDDAKYISGQLGCSIRKWNSLRQKLLDIGKIYISDGSIANERADKLLETSRKFRESQAEKGRRYSKNNDLATTSVEPARAVNTDTDTDIPTDSVPKGTGENADFHKRALFGNGVKYLVAHGRKESEARAIIGRWLKGNSKESVFNAFAAAKEAGAVEPVSYIGRILKGRTNERFDAWGIPDLNADTRTRGHTDRDDSWDAPVYVSEVQPSAQANQQAGEVPVCHELEEWMRVDVPSLRVVGGNG